MIALVAAAVIAASPRPLPNAESGMYVPKLDRIGGLVSFMTRAGERSVTLRPSTWFSEFHPLLFVDFTRRESLATAGIDPAGSVTVSWRSDGRMSCVDLADPKKFEAAARERLGTLGSLWEGKLRGAPVVGARTADGTLVAGYVRKGNVSCAVTASANARPLLEAAVGAVGKPGSTWGGMSGVAGSLFVVMDNAVAGLEGTERVLTVDSRAKLPAPALTRGGSSPYAPPSAGVFSMRAQIAKGSIPSAVRSLTFSLAGLCAKCPAEEISALQRALAEHLTGHVALVVNGLNVKGRLKTSADRYFAAQHAWLAQIDDPAAVTAALAKVKAFPGAKETGAGVTVAVPGGELHLGVQGRHLFAANDSSALKAALDSIPAASGRMEHGVELALDPARASRALASISLFDVLGSKELAGLFALSTEIGPLLSITESARAFVDSDPKGGHRSGVTWTLIPARP